MQTRLWSKFALAAQFSGGGGTTAPQLGLYWGDVKDDFPEIEQHPPAPAIVERFDLPAPGEPSITVQMLSGLPAPRYMFFTADKSRVIQIQNDRFGHNWRKVTVDGEYPRYDTPGSIRDTFHAEGRLCGHPRRTSRPTGRS